MKDYEKFDSFEGEMFESERESRKGLANFLLIMLCNCIVLIISIKMMIYFSGDSLFGVILFNLLLLIGEGVLWFIISFIK